MNSIGCVATHQASKPHAISVFRSSLMAKYRCIALAVYGRLCATGVVALKFSRIQLNNRFLKVLQFGSPQNYFIFNWIIILIRTNEWEAEWEEWKQRQRRQQKVGQFHLWMIECATVDLVRLRKEAFCTQFILCSTTSHVAPHIVCVLASCTESSKQHGICEPIY